jgi:hypothetical protein
MKRTGAITLAIVLALGGAAFAAQIKWDDEACSNRITYDAKKVDKGALKGTIDLLYSEQPFITGEMFQTSEDVARIDIGKLQQECNAIAERRRNHKALPLPGIEDYRAHLIEDVRDSCELEIATRRTAKDGASLSNYKPAAQACAVYVDALDGKTDFERIWNKTVQDSCANNASPAACRGRAVADGQKPDGALRKRLHVLTFGWTNCAVLHMHVNAQQTKREALREGLLKKLKRQFKIASKCQEGD